MVKSEKIYADRLDSYALLILIVAIGFSLISGSTVLGATIDSPKKQMDAGAAADAVVCNSGLTLMVKTSSGSTVCVKPSSAVKLQNRGWGTILKEPSMMDEEREKMLQEKETVYDPQINPDDFVSEINNKFFTLLPGTMFVYESETEDGTEHIEVLVTNETKSVLDIVATVVWDRVWLDNELIEDTRDWYAQDKEGNVWYFGEDTKEIIDGKAVNTKGSWEAGVDGAKPGIMMKANPQVGDSYRQEYYAGQAEDMGEVLALDESVTVPFGSFSGCLKTRDWTPLEPDADEHKYYCSDIGGVALEVVLDGGERVELVEITSEGT